MRSSWNNLALKNKLDECKVVFEILRRDLNSLSEELNWYLESNVAQETET